jgi:hypothetical protein
MPNNKKSPEKLKKKLSLKESKVKALQLKHIFAKMSQIEAEKEIKLKQKKYEQSLVQRKR